MTTASPITDGKFCSEWPLGKTCPNLIFENDCDTRCLKYEKAPHSVWDGENKNFRLSRCPQCVADFGGAPDWRSV